MNIETRFQLQLFLAREVERILDARAQLQQQPLSLTLSTPLFFFCDLTICIRYNLARLFKHIYQSLIHGRPLKAVSPSNNHPPTPQMGYAGEHFRPPLKEVPWHRFLS
jgi:hypothetical protein